VVTHFLRQLQEHALLGLVVEEVLGLDGQDGGLVVQLLMRKREGGREGKGGSSYFCCS